MVTSRRGKTGGWKLTEAPAQTTLLAVVEAIEPETLGHSGDGVGASAPAVTKAWESVQEATRKILASTTLESLGSSEEPMFYI